MPSTYTSSIGLEKPGSGEQSGTWGDTVNTNSDILDASINGVVTLTLAGSSSTLTTTDGAVSDGHKKVLVIGGAPSGTHTITVSPNTAQKLYFVRNTTAQSVVFTQGSGGNATVTAGETAIVYTTGGGATSACVNLSSDFGLSSPEITGGTIDGAVIGGTTPAAGSFTTLTTTGNVSFAASTVTNGGSVTTVDINGGTIDNATVGLSFAAAGQFTTVGVGGAVSASALLDVQSTTKGAILPKMTTAQKNAIASPATGLLVFDTTLTRLQCYNGTAWVNVGPVAGTDVQAYSATLATIAATGVDTTVMNSTTLVTAADTIASNDTDTQIPTTAAVIDYVGLTNTPTSALASWTYSTDVLSIPFTGLAGWDAITVVGVINFTGTPVLEVSDDNGSTWETANYVATCWDDTSFSTTSTTNVPLFRTSSGGGRFRMVVDGLGAAAPATTIDGRSRSSAGRIGFYYGAYTAAGAITAIRLTGATFETSGSVQVFGVRRT